MKVFVTGGTGFIGGHVVRKLRDRDDEVRALVRNPDKGRPLAERGCELVSGSLADKEVIRSAMEGCDAAIHGAAVYEVGIPESEHRAMYEANVLGTENVLRAALEAEVPRVVYVSTVAAFGNTRGRVVDEGYEHPGTSFTSYYEQTKVEAHRLAKRLIVEEGLPCAIVQPGGVYGPDDHSAIGQQMKQFLAGRMPLIAFPEAGFNMVHVDDVADGVLLALDKGKPGEAYILGGQITTMRETIDTLGRVSGRKPPSRALPTGLMKAMTPFGPLVGKVMGQGPNLRELINSADNVTFWAKHDKAMAELGYAPRGLEQGLRDTLAAQGIAPAAPTASPAASPS
ncbi:MAG TPA: NAD-dependent epimerase/dehydratase family protein [Solirubrobacterales bacterium]|nr:NAD-dependent epimerase/dehydratase family protein [Solirubrobacterales bacterium]